MTTEVSGAASPARHRLSRRQRYITLAVAGYALLAAAWIYFSERLLGAVADPETMVGFGTAKGLAFVAVTAVLFAIALAKMPAAEVGRSRRSTAQRPWSLLAVFLAMSAVITTAGSLAYLAEIRAVETTEMDRLGGVVKLKAAGLERWIGERRSNVEALTESLAMRRDVAQLLGANEPGARERIALIMRIFTDHYGFSALRLYDAAGRLRLSVGASASIENQSDLAAVVAARQATFLDLRPGSEGSELMGFVAPVTAVGDEEPLGAIAFELSPGQFLYPFLRNWPTTSRTRETFLAHRVGDVLIAISPRLHGASNIRLGSNGAWLLQSAGANSGDGEVTGAAVLMAQQPVAGTPWILVAKVDRDETLAGIKHAAFDVGVIVALAVFATAGLLVLMWQRRRLREALTEISLNDYLVRVTKALPGTLLSFRMLPNDETSVPYASKNLTDLVGIDPAALAHDAAPLFALIHPDDVASVRRAMQQSAAAMSLWHQEFRMAIPARGEIWVEVRLMPEPDVEGGVIWHGFSIDVTERKSAEERLRLASTVFTSAHDGIILTDRNRNIIAVNPAFSEITGYSEQEAIGQTPRLLRSGRHDAAFYRAMWDSIAASGYWQGEIWNRRKNGEIYPEWMTISAVRDPGGEIVNYVATFADVSRLKQSEAEVEQLASHDPLTGLPNRLSLRMHLTSAVARAKVDAGVGAVLLLDLDRFRIVNDSCGHATGDKLLVQVAQRLKSQLSGTEVVARTSGDGFTVVLPSIACRTEAGEKARRLRAALTEPFVLEDGQVLYIGASFGISLFPEDAGDAEQLIQQAGAALNHAKAVGGNVFCFYSAIFTDNAVARITLETDLRRALEHDEFVLHYQPLVAVADQRIKGVEALIRWRAPGGTLIPPGLFIPVAEETGMIIPLGEWVLRTACRQMAAWRAAGVLLDCIAVNLSPAQFSDPSLTQRISDILSETGLPAACLELEITEGSLVALGSEVADRLADLKKLGVRLAIDDFGTGYSSLAYLKRFPIDKLKIDRSFITGLPHDQADAKITHAVIEMGRSLRLEVLAEGVETGAQLEFLREHGCETVQGFLFGAALPADDIADMVRKPQAASQAIAIRRAPRRRPRPG